MTVSLYIRISDNVLEEEDWPIKELILNNGVVVGEQITKNGVYGFDLAPTINANAHDVEKWGCYDSTGQHPEIYHEVGIMDANGKIHWHGNRRDVLGICSLFFALSKVNSHPCDPINSPNVD